ncbi:7308_t:CDS:2 [Dentiscutata erythropus]|uniref:7308_t:CDS:1 n=1 Tax=Dentiscutata erythropus TaxID=1348616 RepID=A0A9N9P501_9GLOM|nr:7308_t:CDS:2 [Dentiscutata erythropus]
MNKIEVKAFYEELATFEGGISNMSISIQNVTAKYLQKRQQALHYYSITYYSNGNIPYTTITITEAVTSQKRQPQLRLQPNNLYPSDVEYVVLGTICSAIVGTLGGIALSFGINKRPTPISDST